MRAWMAFDNDGTYRAVFEERREQGTFWIDGYKLYTQAKGSDQIVTRINQLDSTTLVIGMNRAGTKEEITFNRGKVFQIEGSGDPK